MMSYFVIESKHNGLVLDIAGGGAKGAHIKTWKRHDGPNQLWQWKEDMLVSKTGYALDVQSASSDAGTSAIAWDNHGRPNQRWKVEGDQIISKLNGLALDIRGGSREAGASVILWPKHGGKNQAWKIVGTYHLFSVYITAKVLINLVVLPI